MKSSRWGSLLLLMVQLPYIFLPAAMAQQVGAAVSPPGKMRLCVGTGCANLTWSGDHYDARNDGSNKISSRYWINEWTADHVEFIGKTAFAVYGVFPAQGTFTAKISPAGNSVTGGRDDWHIGPSQSGTLPFTLTWDKPTATTSNPSVAAEPAPVPQMWASNLNGEPFQGHRSKTHHNILLPPGAAEVYASYPDDIRAILMSDYSLSHTVAMHPCDDAKEDDPDNTGIHDARLSLEIGKFALRSGDYPRGRCWINHSAVLDQNPRAVVILGVLHLLGWGLPKDAGQACHFFSSEYRSGDPWAAYFLDRCYREGLGGPVNVKYAGQIETSAFLSDDAQRMFDQIGSDDLEQRKQKDIAALRSDPDIYYKKCTRFAQTEIENQRSVDPVRETCSDFVDERLLNERVKQINDRYDAIK